MKFVIRFVPALQILLFSIMFSSLIWQNFHEIDTNSDGFVSPEEIYDIKYDDLERLLGYIEDEGEEEEEENIEGENVDSTKEHDTQTEETSGHSTKDADKTPDREHTEL